MSPADTILKTAMGKFPVVLVIGLLENNSLDITTNAPQYPVVQWLLNKASFELFVHENTNQGEGA